MSAIPKASVREVLVGALLLLGAASGAWAQSPAPISPVMNLAPGDVVEVTVWQRPELSGEFVVAADGTLFHPLFRQVRVTDVPVDQVRGRLDSFLRTLEANPQFVVQPLHRVSILGAVGQPDIYNLRPGTTVAEAIAGAGGISEDGKADEVRLIRPGSTSRLDLEEPSSQDANTLVRSGDQIMVEQGGEGVFRRVFLPLIQIIGPIASIVNIATR